MVLTPLVFALRNSLRGLRHAAASERAVRQELAALVVAIPAATLLAGSAWQWAALVGVILLVLAVELLNTAIEKLADHVTPEWNTAIGTVKDLGSAAVFAALLLAGVVWAAACLEVFAP